MVVYCYQVIKRKNGKLQKGLIDYKDARKTIKNVSLDKIMKSEAYKDSMENPNWKFDANEKAKDLFSSIWRDMWKIW